MALDNGQFTKFCKSSAFILVMQFNQLLDKRAVFAVVQNLITGRMEINVRMPEKEMIVEGKKNAEKYRQEDGEVKDEE